MANAFDYLLWRGDLGFDKSPFCEIDALILAELSYVPLDDVCGINTACGVTVRAAADEFFKTHGVDDTDLGVIVPSAIVRLFFEMAKTERFGNVVISNYINKTSDSEGKQFSALTARISKSELAVMYRGTDDTIVGWKENFTMAFMTPVPAQLDSVKYLDDISLRGVRRVYVGGHSKGGNLAVYAAAKCRSAVKKRIGAVYDFDGPGFKNDFFDSADYAEIGDRTYTFVPEESVVGMLLEHGDDYAIVKSTNSGLYQHDALSWQLVGCGFEHAPSLSKKSQALDSILSTWLSELSDDDRSEIVSAIFDAAYSTDSLTLTQLSEKKTLLAKALLSLDADQRKLIYEKFSALVAEGAGTIIGDVIKPKLAGLKKDIFGIAEKLKRSADDNKK